MIRTTGRVTAAIIVAAIFVADQATKLFVLHGVDFSAGPLRVLPFMNITLVYNRGISYGLFQTEGVGRWVLVAVTAGAAIALGIWMWRAVRPVVRLALAMIVGGALGNLVDRVAYGAVVDFVQLHAAGWSWYVFNIADAAIVLGVVLLVIDGFLPVRARQKESAG
ncbi:MAG: signal peptidase II [Pseudomonadota bacterium]